MLRISTGPLPYFLMLECMIYPNLQSTKFLALTGFYIEIWLIMQHINPMSRYGSIHIFVLSTTTTKIWKWCLLNPSWLVIKAFFSLCVQVWCVQANAHILESSSYKISRISRKLWWLHRLFGPVSIILFQYFCGVLSNKDLLRSTL